MKNGNFAAHLVIKKSRLTGKYGAGFASRISGEFVRSYGYWFGSQMSWKPFKEAVKAAHEEAARLNAQL